MGAGNLPPEDLYYMKPHLRGATLAAQNGSMGLRRLPSSSSCRSGSLCCWESSSALSRSFAHPEVGEWVSSSMNSWNRVEGTLTNCCPPCRKVRCIVRGQRPLRTFTYTPPMEQPVTQIALKLDHQPAVVLATAKRVHVCIRGPYKGGPLRRLG